MGRMLFWSMGVLILVFLAFVPLAFQFRFQVADRFSFSLSGASGPTCCVGVGIGWGRLAPVPNLIGEI